MREILFRGKRINNGEWIEGYLVKLGRESFSDPERYGICNKAIPLGGSGVCYNLRIDEVITETVGQYTGLTDKNGKRIFEGDIVRYGDTIHEVVFEQRNGTAYFGLVYSKIETLPFGHYQDLKQIEVICNIHDNSELIKGE